MVKILKIIFGCFVFSIATVNLYALYEDKSGYSYVNRFADLYVGAYIANAATGSWGQEAGQGYAGLFLPQKALGASNVGINAGFRLFQNIPFIRNVRVEGEMLYNFVKTPTMIDTTKISTEFERNSLLAYGSEVLKNSGAINAYYDFRFFSNNVYPYIGAGVGYGEFLISSLDLNAQTNGLGEQYNGGKMGQFNQIMAGVQYDTKIIKASVYLQYKAIIGGSKITVNPANDGIHDAVAKDNDGNTCNVGEGPTAAGCPDLSKATTSSKDIIYLNHSISFGLKYYLY